MAVSTFFDKFPKVRYDINNTIVNKKYENVTDVFFRIAYMKEVLANASSYYVYELEDGDTPEILADKVYSDAGAAWMIIYANQILDPQFDWPLPYEAFLKHIIDKYGSVETAKTTIHHYEKVITRTDTSGPEDVVTEVRLVVNKSSLTDNTLSVPFDNYDDLPETQSVATFNISGRTVTEIIKRDAISMFDYEQQLNENKRIIKVIKKEYYGRIMKEFDSLIPKTLQTFSPLRRVV